MKQLTRLLLKASALGLGISLVLPGLAFAANVLTWSADTTITLGSNSYTIIADSQADSFVVGTSTVTVQVAATDVFTFRSASRFPLNNDQGVTVFCGPTYSELQINGNTESDTVIVTPDTTTTCGTGGGGGGGGGGSPAPTPTPTPTPDTTPSTSTGSVTATPSAGGSTSFTPSDSGTPSVAVTVPANAVASETTVNVTTTTLASANIVISVSTAGVSATVGSPFSFTATSGGNAVTNFNQPLSVTFSYNESQLPAGASESDLVVLYFNSTSQAWEVLPTTVDPVTNKVTVALTHFSVYVLGVKTTTKAPAGAHPNGTLVLDGKTVWLIKDGKRVGFRNEAEYLSHGYNFGQVVAANAVDKSLAAETAVQKALEGTLVLDSSDNVTVYMIGVGGTKRGFTTAAVFTALGYNFSNLPKINLSDYPVGPVIALSTAAHPDGALVLEGQTVWWIRNGVRQGFESEAVFKTYGFSFAKVVASNSSDLALAQGPLVKFRDGTLVYDGGSYYLISDGKSLKFTSSADLSARGYKTSNAISASLAGKYDDGGSVQ